MIFKKELFFLTTVIFLASVSFAEGELKMQTLRPDSSIFILDEEQRSFAATAIVLGSDSYPSELAGAKELQTYLEKISATELKIIQEKSPIAIPERGIIFIGKGKEAINRGLYVKSEFNKLLEDGFIIKVKNGNVLIAGKGPRASIYGVYRLLEGLGFKFFVEGTEIIPEPSRVEISSLLSRKENPAFAWRGFHSIHGEMMKAFLCPSIRARCGSLRGIEIPSLMHTGFGTGKAWVHAAGSLVPPNKYFNKHPEFFAMGGDGKRQKPTVLKRVHLCLSHPDLAEFVAERIIRMMKENPEARYFSITRGDGHFDSWCQCKKCRELDAVPGWEMSDRMLHFANQVAERTSKKFPDKFVAVLAYTTAAEAPPVRLKPHKNVLIIFCPYVPGCQLHPITAPCRARQRRNLERWIELHPLGAKGIILFTYPVNYRHGQSLWPAFYAHTESIRFYADLGIRGIWICGILSPSSHGSFRHLKSYIFPRLMWNPDIDLDKYITKFMNAHFGEAAKSMREVFELVQGAAMKADVHLDPYRPPPGKIFTPELTSKALEIFELAEKEAENDLIRKRVKLEKLGLLYNDLTLRPIKKISDDEPKLKKQLNRLGEYLKILRLHNIKITHPGIDKWLEKVLGYAPTTKIWWDDPIMQKLMLEPVKTYKEKIRLKY